mgnify:CR=1 FL=1
MKKFVCCFFVLLLIILTSCNMVSQNKNEKKMIEEQYFCGTRYDNDLTIRLTINSNNKYSLYCKGNFGTIEIDEENWSHSLTYKYSYYTYSGNGIEIKKKSSQTLSVYKLENCFINDMQSYFVVGGSPYKLISTNEEITESYLDGFRTIGPGGTADNKVGYINLAGFDILPKNYADAKWE